MHAADRSASAVKVHAQLWASFRPAPAVSRREVVLKPLNRPELDDITVEEGGLVIGLKQEPFASYRKGIVKGLSPEHARIFHKGGSVFVTDLKSRKGTTVNRGRLARDPRKLNDGDEICFGGALAYRVEISAHTHAANLRLTLTPQSQDSGLEPIVIAKFPFHIGKAEVMFSKYVNESAHGQEMEYLSRRHAYIYHKDGEVYVEDLGSSNGTSVDGERLESAVPLKDGAVVAFGGQHFVYNVSITRQTVELATDNAGATHVQAEVMPQADERTQFIAAPDSFLRLLCDANRPKDALAPGGSAVPAPVADQPVVKRRPRGRFLTLLSELKSLQASGESDQAPRRWWLIGGVAGVLVALVLTVYVLNAPERHLKDALANGEYVRAATLASRLLEQHPDDMELRARATEAALKADVPLWLVKVKAHAFGAATTVLSGLSELGTRNADLPPLIGEMEWLGALESLVSSRGGPEAPIRIYADESRIGQLIERWNNDTGEHQRALSRIASRVPEFGDWYGAALTHLRRLQSESTVYLPVIERVKANIAAELERDNPEALEIALKETAEKYPGLAGMDRVRQDLAHYLEIRREARTHQSGRLFAVLSKAQFETPPFQQGLRALKDSGQLPSVALLQQYGTATQAWKDGNLNVALSRLQEMAQGFWAQEIATEVLRRGDVTTRFAALEQTRNTAGFVDQLLAFRESLDAEEDIYFLRATAADLNQRRDAVIARAQDAMNKARAFWQEYRMGGAIDASQRIETSISDRFRSEARMLAEASRYARQGFLIYSQVDGAGAERWAAIRQEIESEASQQRSRLRDLSNVVEPEILKTKLALLGDTSV
jgi:pSer/pThr/pTyr-binding forkhead associated (FHA) protein